MKLRNLYILVCLIEICCCFGNLTEDVVSSENFSNNEIDLMPKSAKSSGEAIEYNKQSQNENIKLDYKIQSRINGVWNVVGQETNTNKDEKHDEHSVKLPKKISTYLENSDTGLQCKQEVENKSKISHKRIRKFDDVDQYAKFLSGVLEVENDDKYKYHSDVLSKSWNKIDGYCFSKIVAFEKKELSDKSAGIDTVFYPFGGPDIAHAVMLFPSAKKYILIGQERAGNASDTQKRIGDDALSAIRHSISSFLRKGYFVTMSMASDLHNKHISGVMPVILLSLSKLGYTIKSVTNENLISQNDDSIKIVFYDKNSQDEKTIYYIQSQLQNVSKKLDKLLSFVTQDAGSIATVIKSCSYCMHMREFSKLRNLVISKSDMIIQDDSGIPVKMINNNIFDVSLYGSYKHPTLGVFKLYVQPDLASMYLNKEKVKSIDFPIGYIGESKLEKKEFDCINLQVFTKKLKSEADN